MHPKNQIIFTKSPFFDWISDYGPSSGARSGKSYMKRHARKTVRRLNKRGLQDISAD